MEQRIYIKSARDRRFLYKFYIGENEMSAKNKEIVEKVNASFAGGSVEGFLSNCADDVVWTMVGNETTKGKNAIREWLSSMDMEPPKFTVNNIIAEGDFVTAYGDMTMKEKDGKTVPYAYCDIYRFQNGKIAELSSFVIKTEARAEGAGGS
jgi:ketosteroid isomerase-like protein